MRSAIFKLDHYQILGIVDVFDALTTQRVYRPPMAPEAAAAELEEEARRGWRSPTLVQEFLALQRSGRLPKLAEKRPGPLPFKGVLE